VEELALVRKMAWPVLPVRLLAYLIRIMVLGHSWLAMDSSLTRPVCS
jgi:hypothetical protein